MTLPELKDPAGDPVTGVTGISACVFLGETPTAVQTVTVTGLAQQGDGTVIVTDASIVIGTTYTVLPYVPGTNFYMQPVRAVAT